MGKRPVRESIIEPATPRPRQCERRRWAQSAASGAGPLGPQPQG